MNRDNVAGLDLTFQKFCATMSLRPFDGAEQDAVKLTGDSWSRWTTVARFLL